MRKEPVCDIFGVKKEGGGSVNVRYKKKWNEVGGGGGGRELFIDYYDTQVILRRMIHLHEKR